MVIDPKEDIWKESYSLFDFNLYYLDPFDNGTLLQDPDVELTMPISNNFITSPWLKLQLNADGHLHESEKDATESQALIDDQLK
jgi:hypothetical protein